MSRRLTQEEFIKKSQEKHGCDHYDYSRVVYKNGDTPIELRCCVHDIWFTQRPENHLVGAGCYQCGLESQVGQRTSNAEIFKERAKKVHGDAYDYSLVVYKTARIPVEIKCLKHEITFFQVPDSHLRGRGCPKCGREKTGDKRRTSADGFIDKCKVVHGDAFDYSLVEFKGTQRKIKLICKKCGRIFEQHANNHLRGMGCQKCSAVERGKLNRTGTEDFIKRSKEKWGELYDYSETEYVDSKTKIKYKCEIHGYVSQLPENHLRYGCRHCSSDNISEKYRKSLEQLIQDFRKVHGDKYIYDNVIYTNNKKKIEIICPEHGPFWQVAWSHLSGCGCQKCSGNGFDSEKSAILYYLKISHSLGVFYKIGITNRTVETRFRATDMKIIEVIRTWSFDNGGEAYRTEQLILKECNDLLAGIDNILVGSGNTEIFKEDIFA